MKFILGICNVFGALLLGYIIVLGSKQMVAMDVDFEAQAIKYKTENAAEAAYITDLYHLGDWTTILADTLAMQEGIGISENARVAAVARIGTAVSFEETMCSFLAAFENDVTAVVKPYRLVESGGTTITTDLYLNSGMKISKVAGQPDKVDTLGTRADLVEAYRQVAGLSNTLTQEQVLSHMYIEFASCINDIVRKAMGYTGYKEQDSIYIPVFDTNAVPGLNPIINQSILVLNGSQRINNSSTTLAGFTKIPKRYYVTFNTPGGLFYSLSSELPTGYSILEVFRTEREAAMAPGVKGQYFRKRN